MMRRNDFMLLLISSMILRYYFIFTFQREFRVLKESGPQNVSLNCASKLKRNKEYNINL